METDSYQAALAVVQEPCKNDGIGGSASIMQLGGHC